MIRFSCLETEAVSCRYIEVRPLRDSYGRGDCLGIRSVGYEVRWTGSYPLRPADKSKVRGYMRRDAGCRRTKGM